MMAVGRYHSLVLTIDNRLYSVGKNNNGQLGDGTTTDSHVPIEITSLGSAVAIVAVGAEYSLLIKTN